MKIISGPHEGHSAKLRQFANAWMTGDCDCGTESQVFKPWMAEFDPGEARKLRESHSVFLEGASFRKSKGEFWNLYRLEGNVLVRNDPSRG